MGGTGAVTPARADPLGPGEPACGARRADTRARVPGRPQPPRAGPRRVRATCDGRRRRAGDHRAAARRRRRRGPRHRRRVSPTPARPTPHPDRSRRHDPARHEVRSSGAATVDAGARKEATMRQPDLAVIGGGATGLGAAMSARGAGADVVLVERDRLGGDCTWTGCVPSKTIIEHAQARPPRPAHRRDRRRRHRRRPGACARRDRRDRPRGGRRRARQGRDRRHDRPRPLRRAVRARRRRHPDRAEGDGHRDRLDRGRPAGAGPRRQRPVDQRHGVSPSNACPPGWPCSARARSVWSWDTRSRGWAPR